MKQLRNAKRRTRDLISRVGNKLAPIRWKEFNELSYWKSRKAAEGVLSNTHYEHFYTAHFGLNKSYYDNRVVVDLGCGPRGSLEWATTASRRIGVDPLANEYLRLGANRHQMEYFDSSSENIPLKDAECDVVCSFNSLDHVVNIDQTLREIKRITRAGGLFLLLVEVNHPPTDCEPHQLNPQLLLESLRPEFICERLEVYEPVCNGMYESIRADEKRPEPEETKEIGYLSARFLRVSQSAAPDGDAAESHSHR